MYGMPCAPTALIALPGIKRKRSSISVSRPGNILTQKQWKCLWKLCCKPLPKNLFICAKTLLKYIFLGVNKGKATVLLLPKSGCRRFDPVIAHQKKQQRWRQPPALLLSLFLNIENHSIYCEPSLFNIIFSQQNKRLSQSRRCFFLYLPSRDCHPTIIIKIFNTCCQLERNIMNICRIPFEVNIYKPL